MLNSFIIKHRKFSKTILWSAISSILTLAIVLKITDSWLIAFYVIGFEFIFKPLFYYLHEKLWHISKRSARGIKYKPFYKTITFCLPASLVTVVILFVLKQNLVDISMIVGLEILSKSMTYYYHERIWDNFKLKN